MKNLFKKMINRIIGNFEFIVNFTDKIKKNDIKKSKITACLGYFCFIIPMVINEDKQFARFHANQSVLILLLSTVVAYLFASIPYIGIFLVALIELICIGLTVRGMFLAINDKAKSIPVLGWITIIAYRLPSQA